jgi:hypothetical protein
MDQVPSATWRPWWARLIAVVAIVAATSAIGFGVLCLVGWIANPGQEMASIGLALAIVGVFGGLSCGLPFALFLLRGGKAAFVIGMAMLGLTAYMLA